MAQIDTLIDDIKKLFVEGKECDPANVEAFGRDLANLVADRLKAIQTERAPTLRMSNLGRGDRQLWYEVKSDLPKEDIPPHTRLKFLYGDIIEAVMLFLAKEAGHEVTHAQEELRLDGVVGHTDAVIDGVVVDVKSASTYAFKKFRDGTLPDDDAFGYMEQLAAYSKALGGLDGAFLAVDKTLGHFTLMQVPKETLEAYDIEGRISHIKEVLESDTPPERCYDPEPFGKSGNMKLGVNCSYCPFKFHCWQDANGGIGLRTFLYSDGPVHMTEVEKEPNVPELTF